MKPRITKYFLMIFLIGILYAPKSFAQDIDLNRYDSSTFSTFAGIAGQILGSGFYHTSSIHNGGLDIGVKTMVGIIPDDKKSGPFNDTRYMPLPVIQANVGILNKIE